MANTRNKMYASNSLIRKYLVEQGFTNIYFFPHLRFMKDYHLNDCAFDGIAWKNKLIHLMQFKTNKNLPSTELQKYKIIEKENYCKCLWITVKKGKVLIQGTLNKIKENAIILEDK